MPVTGNGHPGRRVQYAALPYRVRSDGEVQVRLITSRETRRWVIPKGWPIKGLSPAKTAAREAYEEAGLMGAIAREAIGIYTYEKNLGIRSVLCDVMVFPLKVKRHLNKWPERSQRYGFWFSVETAAAAVQEEDLKGLILSFGELLSARLAAKRAKAAAKDEAKPEAKSATKSVAKSVAKADAGEAVKAGNKAAPKAGAKPDAASPATAKRGAEPAAKASGKAKAGVSQAVVAETPDGPPEVEKSAAKGRAKLAGKKAGKAADKRAGRRESDNENPQGVTVSADAAALSGGKRARRGKGGKTPPEKPAAASEAARHAAAEITSANLATIKPATVKPGTVKASVGPVTRTGKAPSGSSSSSAPVRTAAIGARRPADGSVPATGRLARPPVPVGAVVKTNASKATSRPGPVKASAPKPSAPKPSASKQNAPRGAGGKSAASSAASKLAPAPRAVASPVPPAARPVAARALKGAARPAASAVVEGGDASTTTGKKLPRKATGAPKRRSPASGKSARVDTAPSSPPPRKS